MGRYFKPLALSRKIQKEIQTTKHSNQLNMKTNTLRKIRILLMAAVALLAMLAAQHALAQMYGTLEFHSLPAAMAGGSTTNQSAIIDCRQNRHFFITVSGGAVSNATTLTANFLRSPDAILWDDTPYVACALNLAANSTGATNRDFDLGACGYVKFVSAVAGTYSLTNPAVKVSLKPDN